MGKFEEKIAAGMANADFAEGYAEAQAELSASEPTISWELVDTNVLTVTYGISTVAVDVESPSYDYAKYVMPQVMIGRPVPA